MELTTQLIRSPLTRSAALFCSKPPTPEESPSAHSAPPSALSAIDVCSVRRRRLPLLHSKRVKLQSAVQEGRLLRLSLQGSRSRRLAVAHFITGHRLSFSTARTPRSSSRQSSPRCPHRLHLPLRHSQTAKLLSAVQDSRSPSPSPSLTPGLQVDIYTGSSLQNANLT
nr:hypothetical protein Iba_chr15fCG6730 [Ipomoea batatas]